MKYLVILERRAGGYRAWVPDLAGCAAVGRTRKVVMARIEDALHRHITMLLDAGEAVPQPVSEAIEVDVRSEPLAPTPTLEAPTTRSTVLRPATRRRFARYVGIDYSGAETPEASLTGLRVFVASDEEPPREEPPPPGPKKYWTRVGIAHWLSALLSEDITAIVGIDHGFSFPLKYFEKHSVPHDWDAFLDDFERHWPTGNPYTYVDFVRDGAAGAGHLRSGMRNWRRVTETRSGSAKSVFHFDVQGSVAKSTHAGLPWLRYIARNATPRPHFWPFDGWDIAPERSAVVEVYPRLWKGLYPVDSRNPHQQDAFAVASWLRDADSDGRLSLALLGPTDAVAREAAVAEGWILGVE